MNSDSTSPRELSPLPLTVGRLRSRGVNIPLGRPIQTASGLVTTSPVLLIDLVCEEGVTGCAYVFCYTPRVLAPLGRLIAELEPLLEGKEATPERLQAALLAHFRLLGTKGLVGMVVSGIDMAAWDAAGKAHGIPLTRLLGGALPRVRAYAGIRSMRPVEAASEAEEAVAAGFRAIKVKLGNRTLADDLALLRTVRAAAGDRVSIMVDYNQSLSFDEALRRGRALQDESVTWLEEPLEADDDAGHAALARSLEIPIQLGENWWGPAEAARSIALQAADRVTFDVARIGGVTGWLAASRLAQRADLPVSSHRYPEMSACLLAATPTSDWLEYVDTVSPVLAEPLRVENGDAIVPTAPGAALAWDEPAVARFLVC